MQSHASGTRRTERGYRNVKNGDVSLAGEPVIWDRAVFNGVGGRPQFFHNVFADVTEIIAPIIDATPASITEIPVVEIDTFSINGTVLIVIFDDPNQTTDNSIILLFGDQATGGENFVVNLANPIDQSVTKLDMGLGIGHSFQGLQGTPMVNHIDVNGVRLTSSAGGEDDGVGEDGGLITVGGVGDTNDNPDPQTRSLRFRTDDELYNLLPFVSPGDQQISVFSLNPTDDDNIFFAYFVTSVPSAILPVVTPPGPRKVVLPGVCDDEPVVINRDIPTIVLTHGLTPGTFYPNSCSDSLSLWTSYNFDTRGAAGLLRRFTGDSANIIQYVWEEAFQGIPIVPRAYIGARGNVYDAGIRLARELTGLLGSDYQQSIHFIGHSLGTAVNTYAARRFLNTATGVQKAQFTALDRPHHIERIPGLTNEEVGFYRFDQNFFANILPITRPNLTLKIDNYFAATRNVVSFAGVGDKANGPVYNHPALVNPNDLDDTIFADEGFSNDHSGVQQWYRWTIDPTIPFPSATFPNLEQPGADTVCDGASFTKNPGGFDSSLNPCQKGWHWALNGNNPSVFPANNGNIITPSAFSVLRLEGYISFGCTPILLDANTIGVNCTEASSPFGVADVNIPSTATFLSFDYQFLNTGDGDYAAVLIDNIPIWVLSGLSATEGELIDSGPIPINGLTGKRRITIALYGVGQPNAELQIQNFRTSSVIEGIPQCFGVHATIVGTDGRDRLTGTQGRDVIVGLGGNDIINGRGGNDLICGGKGRDKLNGGKGKDKLDGGTGRDICKGGPGRDIARRCERVSKIP